MTRHKRKRYSLRWNANALSDLETILGNLDAAAHEVADRFEQELLAAVEPLCHFPDMGRVPRDFDWRSRGCDALRELIVSDYRVGYTLEGRFVELLCVVHSRRRFPPVR